MAFRRGNEMTTCDPNVVSQAIGRHREKGGLVILEPAFGGCFAVDLPDNAISVGIDPGDYQVSIAGLRSGVDCERIFFTEYTRALLVDVAADAVVMVAPSPSDVAGMLADLESVTMRKTRFLVLFENESCEAVNGETAWAVRDTVRWLNERGLTVEVDDEFGDDPDAEFDEEFSEYLQMIGLPGGILKSRNFGRESRWIVVTGLIR